MKDITFRLRDYVAASHARWSFAPTVIEAADEIERLRGKLAAAVRVLQRIGKHDDVPDAVWDDIAAVLAEKENA